MRSSKAFFQCILLLYLVPTESAPRGDKLSASVSKGKKNKEGKESRSSKGQAGSRPSSQVNWKGVLGKAHILRFRDTHP